MRVIDIYRHYQQFVLAILWLPMGEGDTGYLGFVYGV
jgi:hypothetical protein